MANWKKLIISGSDANLASLSVDTSVSAASITGSNLLVNGNAQFIDVLGVANEIVMVGSNNSITSSAIISLDPTNNYLGINQPNPEVTLHMTGDGAQTAQIRMEQYNDSSDAPDIRTRKARGTSALPSKNDAGDFIYRQNSERYNGSTYTTVGQFAVDSTGSADRFRLTLAVSEDGNTIDAVDAQFMIDGNNGGAIKFNDSYYFPTSDGTNGQALITNGSGSISFGAVSSATSASYAVSASHVEFADNTRNAVSASYAVTASYAVSASVEIIKEVSSSYADTASVVSIITETGSSANHPILFGSNPSESISVKGDPNFYYLPDEQTLVVTKLAGNLEGAATSAQTASVALSGTGNFSGSFEGDGSNLTGVGAFPYTGSGELTGSLLVTGSIYTNGNVTMDVFSTPQTSSGNSIIPDNHYAKMFGPVLVGGSITVGTGSILKVEPF